MRIDAHQHFWNYDPMRDAWITEPMKKIQRDFLPGDLVPILKENFFDGCVAVQTDQSETETEFLLGLASHNHFIKGVVGWVDLCSPTLRERLEHYSQFKVLKGFRHIVQGEPDDAFLLRDDFCRGIGMLSEFGFTYDLLLYPRQFPAAEKFAGQFPDLRLVIDHLAKPSVKTKEINSWAGHLGRLAQHDNVHCKLSGLITEADWKTWNYNDLVPYIEVAADHFGTDRLLYGSDWPVCLVAANYREQLTVWEKYFRTYLVHEQDAVFGGNAVRFYKL